MFQSSFWPRNAASARLNDADFRARIAEFNRILELEEFWETRARQLSLGQRVRCDLAAALLHDAPVVFLDEPTIGMDVVVVPGSAKFLQFFYGTINKFHNQMILILLRLN